MLKDVGFGVICCGNPPGKTAVVVIVVAKEGIDTQAKSTRDCKRVARHNLNMNNSFLVFAFSIALGTPSGSRCTFDKNQSLGCESVLL